MAFSKMNGDECGRSDKIEMKISQQLFKGHSPIQQERQK